MTSPTAVFGENEVAEASRVRLSRLTLEHLDGMTGWIEAALSPDWGVEELRRAVEAGDATLISDGTGGPIGAPGVVLEAREAGAATIPFTAIEPSRRYRGLGGAAGLALERHLRRRFAVERVYAPVPDGRGLAVYFWLRLGFRPLTRAEAPWPLVGLTGASSAGEALRGIWMLRGTE